MFENFGINITNIFKNAENIRKELHHPYVGTEHMLLSILKSNDECINILNNYGLTYDVFYKELVSVVGVSERTTEINLYTPLLKRVINNALENAKENNDGLVTVRHLIISMLEEGEGIAIRLIVGMNIDIDLLYNDLNLNKRSINKKLSIYEVGSLLNDKVDKSEIVVGRDNEIELIIETLLRKKKNNPLLIGEAGVGKTAIVEELTRRIERKDVPEELFNTNIVMLEMGSLVSGTKYRGEFEEKLTTILKEVEDNDNIILFIDEIHTMVNAGGAEGAITAGDILKPCLARGNIKCIGATTIHEYNKYFDSDKALKRRFESIVIDEPNKSETKDILLKIKKEYETHHNVIIPENLIDEIVDCTSKFIFNKKNPDKSIDFLDSVSSYIKIKNSFNNDLKLLYDELDKTLIKKKESVKNNDYDLALNLYNEEIYINDKINTIKNNKTITLTSNDILSVLENKTNLPLTKQKLLFINKMNKDLNNKYYNLSKEIDIILNTIKNNFLDKNTFIRFYLKGSIGLGKSSLVESISNNIPKNNFIKLDMKEYTNSTTLSKLLGISKGYVGYNDEYVFNKIKNNTFNILLIDNYECACDEVKNIIKEILETGFIRDNKDELISFNNTIIFVIENTEKKSIVGFNNKECIKNNEISSIVNETIIFKDLTLDVLNNYLDFLNIKNDKKDFIINKSNYELYNYKNINILIKKNCDIISA